MNSNFGYTGRVTLKTVYNKKIVHTQYFNSGTELLFKAYAMALSGQGIKSYLPAYINIYNEKDESVLNKTNGISIVRTYAEPEIDDKTTPCTRITITLTNSMFNNGFANSNSLRLDLLAPPTTDSTNTLASVEIANNDVDVFKSAITNAGSQLIIVWDLYVENKPSNNVSPMIVD